MTVPSLAVQVQGQSAVTADNINTFVQNCTTAAVLRNFVGLPGMVVYLDGIASQNDGHAGAFYWNPTGVAPDDNLNVIVPAGAATGEWVRLSLGGSGGSGPCTSVANSFQFNNAGAFGCNAGVISTHSGASAWGQSIDEIDFNGNEPGGADITSKSAASGSGLNGNQLAIVTGSGDPANTNTSGGNLVVTLGSAGGDQGGGGGGLFLVTGSAAGVSGDSFSGASIDAQGGSASFGTPNSNTGLISLTAGNWVTNSASCTGASLILPGPGIPGNSGLGQSTAVLSGGNSPNNVCGDCNLNSGTGQYGGAINLTGGNSTSFTGNYYSGSVNITAGHGTNSNGATAVFGGGAQNGFGGLLTLTGGAANGANSRGGAVTITGGANGTSASGGGVQIIGGSGGSGGPASTGYVLIQGGGTANASAGGNVVIEAGLGNVANSYGNIIMDKLPTANPHVVGALWNNGGVLNISSG